MQACVDKDWPQPLGVDSELLGVALLRGPDHAHGMTHAKDDLVPDALIARVLAGNGPVTMNAIAVELSTSISSHEALLWRGAH